MVCRSPRDPFLPEVSAVITVFGGKCYLPHTASQHSHHMSPLSFLSSYNIPPFSPYPLIVTGQDTPADRWETLSEFSTRFSAIILLLKRVKGLCRLSITNGSLTSHFMQMMRCLSVTLTPLWQVDLLFTRTTFRPLKMNGPKLNWKETNIWEIMDLMIVYYVHIYYSIWDFLFIISLIQFMFRQYDFFSVSCAPYWFTCNYSYSSVHYAFQSTSIKLPTPYAWSAVQGLLLPTELLCSEQPQQVPIATATN